MSGCLGSNRAIVRFMEVMPFCVADEHKAIFCQTPNGFHSIYFRLSACPCPCLCVCVRMWFALATGELYSFSLIKLIKENRATICSPCPFFAPFLTWFYYYFYFYSCAVLPSPGCYSFDLPIIWWKHISSVFACASVCWPDDYANFKERQHLNAMREYANAALLPSPWHSSWQFFCTFHSNCQELHRRRGQNRKARFVCKYLNWPQTHSCKPLRNALFNATIWFQFNKFSNCNWAGLGLR